MDTCTENCGKGITASKVREKHFVWALVLNGGLAIGEIITSILTGSSALLADGLMNVDDVAALLLSIYSERKTRQAPDERQTFGYQRMDVFAGFVKGCLLLVTSLLALIQAVRLILEPEEIAAVPVIIVGIIAVIVNLASALGLKEDACHSLNAKGTFSCMAYDAIGSAAVVVSAVLSLFVQTVFFDVAAAFLIAFFMAKTGWGIFREGMRYFLQSAPEGFDYGAFERAIKAVKGVSSVGDIHVWSLTPTEHHLTCKVVLRNGDACDCDRIISAIEQLCRERFHIEHATIQPVYGARTLQRFCKTS
jgi:cobalt-zinc-cadmium efflux system protein